ncbi:LysR substrate-binding domain-containing protein [Algihabitans albus]|uniref:LysR substrate-binding domain-containing protein n=1 Tax=Algihabitans albus TaxID=2164067 RepID=UPI000E5CF710|nr:LysR substrate-binding domain-containing protein [Algihabitans albus]
MKPTETTLIETDLLRTFVAISETGSFAAAAKRVCRTPSAVSMQMKRLEEILGQELFTKSGRTVAINRQGEMLLGYGRQILRLNQETISRFRVPPLEGRVSFGAPDDFGTRFLPSILARFAATHPDVSVEVVLAPSVHLIELVGSGELDLTLVTTEMDKIAGRSERVVYSEPLVWVGLAGGAAKTKSPLPLALSGRGCSWRSVALNALDRIGRPYKVSYTCENCQGQLAALLADLAVAPLPVSLMTSRYEQLGAADRMPSLGPYQIRLIEKSALSEAGRAFADHVVESFQDL